MMSTLTQRVRIAARAAVGIFSDNAMVQAWNLLGGVLPGGMGIPPARGTAEYLKAYSQMPWLRAVTSRIANAVARADWQLFVLKASQSRTSRTSIIQRAAPEYRRRMLKQAVDTGDLDLVAPDHPLLTLINQANEFQTGYAMRKVTQLHLDLIGDGFWLKERDAQGTPIGVWPIPPNWIMATPTPAFRFFRVSFRAWRGNIPDTEFVWFSDPDPLNPYGRGTGSTQAITDELETDEYAARMGKAFFYNNAKPDLLIWPKNSQGISDANIKRLEEDWMSKTQGFFRAFKPYFLSREVEVKELDMNFRSLQLVQLRQFERDLILQQFGVPPEILGVLEHCLDENTECLTRRGWLRHDVLAATDEIATWNEEYQRLEFHRPTEIVRYDYSGPMHHWTGKGSDFLCTPQHQMWVKHGRARGKREGWVFATSQEVASWTSAVWRVTGGGYVGSQDTVILPGKWHGLATPGTIRHRAALPIDQQIAAETFAPFLGYYVAEGWSANGDRDYGVFYGQAEGRFVSEMRDAIQHLRLGEVYERARPNRSGSIQLEWRLAHKALWTWLDEHVGRGAANKHLPVEVFEWPYAAQLALLTALLNGDGSATVRQTTCWRYGSMSEGLIDDIQRLAILLGLCTSKSPAASDQGMWTLTLTQRQTRALDRYRNSWMRSVHYDGTVWCVTVPNHRFFTRRNGQVALHGNSNRSTIDAADYLMNRYVVEPRLEFLRTVLQERFVPEFDEKLIIDYASPVQEDRAAQAAAATAAPWSLSMDEWRAMAGQKPMEDEAAGALHMVPYTMTPTSIEELVAPPPPPPAPVLPPGPGAQPSLAPPPKGWQRQMLDDAVVATEAGDLTLATALRKATSLDIATLPAPSAVAARMEPGLARALGRAWAEHRGKVSLPALERALGPAGVPGDVFQALDVPGLAVAQTAALVPQLVRGFLRGAEVGAGPLRRAGIEVRDVAHGATKAATVVDLAAVNPKATAWAQTHAAQLVEAPAEVQARIRRLIARANETGITPQELARLIQNVIGLDDRRADAVMNFQSRLLADDVASDLAAARASRYAGALLRDRATTIARTELIGALNQGQQALWSEAVAQGVIQQRDFDKVWITANDDLVEEDCEALADERVGIDEAFSNGEDGPPDHPNCRCALGLEPSTEKAARGYRSTIEVHNHLEGLGTAIEHLAAAVKFRQE